MQPYAPPSEEDDFFQLKPGSLLPVDNLSHVPHYAKRRKYEPIEEDGFFRRPTVSDQKWFNEPAVNYIKSSVLDEAKQLIYGDREKDYGSPQRNFQVIASLWSAYTGTTIIPKDVVIMMALLKLARILGTSMPVRDQRDTVIDAAGYIGLLERLEE